MMVSGKNSRNTVYQVLLASMAGTTIEFFDFYIYATAAVLVFPKLFFPGSDPTSATLQSLATFALAFLARPIGAVIFGHFGDRVGRKSTLVAALLTMGPSTVAIGFLPTYDSIGIWAPVLLAAFRIGQGLGLGGEWGGAILLSTEYAPANRYAWYGMFPQLGAPIGFILSSGVFLVLSKVLTETQFLSFGWRIPFVASAVLVWLGLYIRLKLVETPAFQKVLDNKEQVKVPFLSILTQHTRALLQGTFVSLTTFVLFYVMTVFTLSWGTAHLHYAKSDFLVWQMIAMLFFALGILISAYIADKVGTFKVLTWASAIILFFGLFLGDLFQSGHSTLTLWFLIMGLFLMGLTFGPLGTGLAQMFPASVRYTGASLAFTLASILGASVAPYIATDLATRYGMSFVGYYLASAAFITLCSLMANGACKKINQLVD